MSPARTVLLIASLMLTLSAADEDLDGDAVDDATDNCSEFANASQCDTNSDGIGNHCDADLDNNCIVNSFDLSIMRSNLGALGDNDADLDCNGVVNSFDLSRMRAAFGTVPGPSRRANDCVARCSNPVINSFPLRWTQAPRSGSVVTDSRQLTTACPDGTLMELSTQGLTPGNAYTVGFGFFNNPDACQFPAPATGGQFECGLLDVYNPLADGNFVWGAGFFADGVDDIAQVYVAAGAQPQGGPLVDDNCGAFTCANEWVGTASRDEHRGILTNPGGAEYHSVVRNHGVPVPAHPDQTTSYNGGCLPPDDNGTPLDPTDDTPAEPNWPCVNEQVSGAASELPDECFDDPSCVGAFIGPGAFVVGRGLGTTGAAELQCTISVLSFGGTTKGHFRMIHHDENGDFAADLIGDIDCLSTPVGTAYATGIITDVVAYGPNYSTIAGLVGEVIAFTIQDPGAGADALAVNIPAAADLPIIGRSTHSPGDSLVGGCEGAWDPLPVDEKSGNFWVSDQGPVAPQPSVDVAL